MAGQAIGKKLMDQKLRIYTVDGRILEGELRCMDHSGNLVLVDSVNIRQQLDKSSINQNSAMGVVIVPKAQRLKVEVIMTKKNAEEFLNIAEEGEFAVQCKDDSWDDIRAELENETKS
eukprot:TRINITY_DN20538_c4_g1_i1.p2 TRINITY_DN20538_c4_g1~~TRINITY_DN20538_c4_g1_i1.p2  ORF type:complete len:118 (-),score=19.38 TRINITY_DN20538_c4_g1_i1:320-673(-)